MYMQRGGEESQERRDEYVFELPSEADEQLKSGTHHCATLCRAAGVTDQRGTEHDPTLALAQP